MIIFNVNIPGTLIGLMTINTILIGITSYIIYVYSASLQGQSTRANVLQDREAKILELTANVVVDAWLLVTTGLWLVSGKPQAAERSNFFCFVSYCIVCAASIIYGAVKKDNEVVWGFVVLFALSLAGAVISMWHRSKASKRAAASAAAASDAATTETTKVV